MPKKGGPNHRRFTLTIYRMSGEPVTVPGCRHQTPVAAVCQAVADASQHLLPDDVDWWVDEYNVYLIAGFVSFHSFQGLTLGQAKIDQYTLLSVVITDGDEPPPLVDSD